ncbi:MAG: dephospho-CoA kinase [Bacillota bacterium]
MKRSDNKILGLTGGIGSGKSTVAGILKAHGFEIIDADEISKTLTSQKGPLLDELTQTLGQGILDSAGNFDRKKTADLVFGDTVALDKLQTILHRHILAQMKSEIQMLKEKGIGSIALDVPLPVREGFLDLCDEVWVVSADEEVRIARLMASRGYTREECVKRMSNQLSPKDYLALADVVIDNNGDEKKLQSAINRALLHFM